MENNTKNEELLIGNEMNLKLLEKGKLAYLKKREEEDYTQAAKDKDIFDKLVKLANERFGGEFSWSLSRQGDYYIITNIEERLALGSLGSAGIQYIKECKDCGQLISSVEVYLHDLILVKNGTIRFNHRCVEKLTSPKDVLIEALDDYVISIVEDLAQ